ncbi:MAG TPA: ankyrin repeat domain-containing protein [Thermoanaerobaculia bacterium]|nr:ankyrin repeat domain-containing protein [Thermoanaerobaculia bacterium]
MGELREVGAAERLAGEEEPVADETRPAVLDSGQRIEGDFSIRSLDQALAESDVEGAMSIAIETDPELLRAHLADGTFDPNLRLRGSGDYYELPLEKAVRQGAPGTVEILLAAVADPNGQDASRGSALDSAAYQGGVDLVRRLLEAGADPNLAGGDDRRAIEMAAFQGHLEVVRALLDGGAELHFALHSASHSGNLELVEALLAAGANARASTQFGESAMRGAAGKGHLDIVETLLAAGTKPCELALREASQFGRVEVLRAIGRAGVRFDTPPTQWDPLYTAAYHGQAETVRVLVELGASPSGYSLDAPAYPDYPRTALEVARQEGHAEVVIVLESLGGR